MRVALVGTSRSRERLRSQLAAAAGAVEVVGEFTTLREAGAGTAAVDALIVAPEREHPLEDELGGPGEEPLTPREAQVLDLLSLGLPNRAIAARLRISDQTVKFHVASIMGKLGTTNRVETVRRAVRRGLISL